MKINILHTSSDNPLFTSSKYNRLENRVEIHVNKLVLTLQLEALLSLMRFQDNIMQKWPKDDSEEQTKEKMTLSNIRKLVTQTSENIIFEY